tara:strand:- start:3042 stop:3551 length:510 start_codon:yes stop_codon:yes gene_type:complete
MRFIKTIFGLAVILILAGCATPERGSKFRSYDGPEVTFIVIEKAARKLYLFSGSDVLKTYDVGLGFAPVGHKQFEGDGKTPEGLYYIDRRNPRSRYHMSIGLSYPNKADIAYAKAQGKEPGGDIFIHGRSGYRGVNKGDWTWGCVAVTDEEIEEIYAMVKNGTPIRIKP